MHGTPDALHLSWQVMLWSHKRCAGKVLALSMLFQQVLIALGCETRSGDKQSHHAPSQWTSQKHADAVVPACPWDMLLGVAHKHRDCAPLHTTRCVSISAGQ